MSLNSVSKCVQSCHIFFFFVNCCVGVLVFFICEPFLVIDILHVVSIFLNFTAYILHCLQELVSSPTPRQWSAFNKSRNFILKDWLEVWPPAWGVLPGTPFSWRLAVCTAPTVILKQVRPWQSEMGSRPAFRDPTGPSIVGGILLMATGWERPWRCGAHLVATVKQGV